MKHDFASRDCSSGSCTKTNRYAPDGTVCTDAKGNMDYLDDSDRWTKCSDNDLKTYMSGYREFCLKAECIKPVASTGTVRCEDACGDCQCNFRRFCEKVVRKNNCILTNGLRYCRKSCNRCKCFLHSNQFAAFLAYRSYCHFILLKLNFSRIFGLVDFNNKLSKFQLASLQKKYPVDFDDKLKIRDVRYHNMT